MTSASDAHDPRLAEEQRYLNGLFQRLDDEVTAVRERLTAVQLRPEGTDPETDDLIRRETDYHRLNEKLDRAAIAELGLVFGRIDIEDDDPENPLAAGPSATLDRRYIGRLGIHAPEDSYRTLLLDWRAPMARPFYVATALTPHGVHRRRHIRTTTRTVTAVNDEYLLGTDPKHTNAVGTDITGESTLVAALNEARPEHMASIVEMIQSEQDTIIRDATRGVLVVEGGPGTGKTAVALHRVAYLLYTWREQLAKTGVLVIGPNRVFLDYISRVLPELGETGVVLTTVGEMYPGVRPIAQESQLAREIKGSGEMVYILREAVKSYQTLPDSPIELRIDGVTVTLTAEMVKRSRTRARRSRKPHNKARVIFADHLLDLLAEELARVIGTDPLGGNNLLSSGDVAQLHDDLSDEPVVQDVIGALWPMLTPEDVLKRLTCDEEHLRAVAHEYDEDTINGLLRVTPSDGDALTGGVSDGPFGGHDFPWSASDAALLDELAQIIGVEDTTEAEARIETAWRQHVEDAQGALDILIGSANSDLDDEFDAEVLSAHDVVDAETLAARQEYRESLSTAERAAADYTWAYGHVVVDEAQELSEMEWRMVFRRCPSRWMTLVGDPAQTSSPAGIDDWSEALTEQVASRYTRRQLTVNYRTPREITLLSDQILPIVAPDQQPAVSIRSTGNGVRFKPRDTNVSALVDTYKQQDPARTVVVIAPANAPEATLPEYRSMEQIKGLEFDHVILVDPSALVDEPRGWNDVYVAATRATQTLTIVGELPDPLDRSRVEAN